MRKTTNKEKLQNILIARAMLDDIPDSKLIRGLCTWNNSEMMQDPNHCGAAACFGGWVALHPYFREAYGIRASRGTDDTFHGQPRTRYTTDTNRISERLFGIADAFFPNHQHTLSGKKRSDRAVIKQRLKHAFDLLTIEKI